MNFKHVQGQFPIKKQKIYLNNASIGPLSLPVIKAVNEFMMDVQDYGFTHFHNWSHFADHTVKGRIAELIGADKEEIAFVKNTTEGILIVANGIDWKTGDNVIIADIEYPSNVYCWMNLEKRGVTIRWVKSRDGQVLIDDIANLTDSRTRLVSISAVQFSNGFCIDLERLGEVCKRKRILLNLDAIQYIGVLPINVSRLHIDFLSAGGQKWLLGPIGTGFFYCRKESMDQLHPHNIGYHSVDKSEDDMDYELVFRMHAGRYEEALVNYPGIWGLHAAVNRMLELGMKNVANHILGLNSILIEGLESRGYQVISSKKPGERSGIVSFKHPKIPNEEICKRLEQANIFLTIRGKGLRVSPSIYNDEDEIKTMLNTLPGL